MSNQLNKIQIKAEILTVLSKLQTNINAANVDAVISTLIEQDDKDTIRDILIKELPKANEQKSVLICFLLLKLCDKEKTENALWEVLKNPSVADSVKTVILNILKDMGNTVEYERIEECFENPEEAIDAETKRLLQSAIINPEAQIDFLDFLNSLSDVDKRMLVQSLGADYTSDDLANILNPVAMHSPNSEIGRIAIDILGETKSQLALHNLDEILKFVEDETTIALIKRNISKLKIAGVREDNAIDFYKSILVSKPYSSYASYPDGHGNQAIIFSREREDDETLQFIAAVINDSCGIVDCFGFNEISKLEYERIVDKFYKQDERVFIDFKVAKTLLNEAEKLTRKFGKTLSYEYICWKTLLSDVEAEPVPVELILKTKYSAKNLTDVELEQIYMFDFVQKWFFDTESNDEFKFLISVLNANIDDSDFQDGLDTHVINNVEKIYSTEQKRLLDKRILTSSYLSYLASENTEAELLYSLYFDEASKSKLAQNIIRKSIYEYYVSLKFKKSEETKTTNIFAMKNKPKTIELRSKQIDYAISCIENLWVEG